MRQWFMQHQAIPCEKMQNLYADGEGFEPPVDLRPLQFSRLPP
jgi:hypothetical protein